MYRRPPPSTPADSPSTICRWRPSCAYRLGEHTFLQWVIQDLSQRAMPGDDALAVTSRIALLVNGYIDRVIEGLTKIYQIERQRQDLPNRTSALGGTLGRHPRRAGAGGARYRGAHDVHGRADTGPGVARLPYRGSFLGQRKRRGGAPARGRPAARRGVRANAHDRARRRRHDLGLDLLPDYPNFNVDPLAARLAEHRALRIAIGEPAAEVAGFRTSHEEALRARQVAEIGAQRAQQLFLHAQVALAGLLIDRRDAVRMWVQRTLGQLARDDQSIARLRKTLRVLLEANGSYLEAASRMHVHKNTVLYRVRKAEELLGRPVTDGRLAIEVA